MSELERSDTGAMTESPTLLPGQSGPARPAEAVRGASEVVSPAEPNGSDSGDATDRPPLLDENGQPKKRRRRGSRGGRGRKKPGTGTAGSGGGAARANGSSPASASEGLSESEHWTAASADRGLTDDDIGEQAREEAGLVERPAPRNNPPRAPRAQTPITPRVGDSRPGAPAPAPTAGDDEAPKKRRRRRGGRGRSKGGADRVETPRPEGARPAGGGRKPAAPRYVDAGLPLTDVDVDGTALLDSLDDETLLRRRGTHRKGRPAGRYLMVVHHRDDGIAHIAVLEGRTLVEHYVSMPTDDTLSIDGNIYLGRVQNVLPGMEAAFIDIGTPKNGVLYRGDVVYDPADVEGNQRPRIESVLRNGQSIIVQVTKNPIAHKGARLTQEVSLAGRFVVMVPGQPQTYGISKRLPEDERKRLRQVLDRLRPKDAGLIVRTAAEGATEEELERDMLRLNEQWRQISEFAKKAKPGSLLYKEPPLATRLIREEFTKEFRGVVIDDRNMYEEVNSYIVRSSMTTPRNSFVNSSRINRVASGGSL